MLHVLRMKRAALLRGQQGVEAHERSNHNFWYDAEPVWNRISILFRFRFPVLKIWPVLRFRSVPVLPVPDP